MSDSVAKDLVEVIMINVDNSIPSPGGYDGDGDETLTAWNNSNTSVSEILQKVAQLAESLRTDLDNIQIGDYVVSMNKSPLEIQVKQAIDNYKITEANGANGGILVGQGDGGVENIPLPLDNLQSPSLPASPEVIDVIETDMSTLKRKKYSFARRILRVLRSTFTRKN